MKICISDQKRYPMGYFLFSILFTLTVLLFALLGSHITGRFSASASIPTPNNVAFPVVIIDPGHGGEDGGAIGTNGVYEKDLNLQIAKALDELLRANGVNTVMTRTEDILLYDRNSNYQGQKKVQDLATRRKIAEQYENAVFVSIHMNAFPQAQYSGLQVYYSTKNQNSLSLAESIQGLTKETLLPNNYRSVKPAGENIYLLDRLQCPAVLIECGFLSNPEECERLTNESYQQQLALSLALAILGDLSEIGA